jgi:pancreatic lipase-related protein 2
MFYVDWFNLSSSLCYPAVVHNIKHVGACTAQLVNRIRDAGSQDIHVIGFSLGAQVANYIANSLKPDYLLPRITGVCTLLTWHFFYSFAKFTHNQV